MRASMVNKMKVYDHGNFKMGLKLDVDKDGKVQIPATMKCGGGISSVEQQHMVGRV